MESWLPGPLLGIVVVSLLAGAVAVSLALLAIGVLRRAVRRLGAQVRDLRRHPLVGELLTEADPALRSLALELNHLLLDLRTRVREAQGHSADLEMMAEGPPDVALLRTDPEWRVVAFGRGAVNLTGWEPLEILGHHVEVLFAPGEWELILPKLARRSLREAGLSETVRLQRRDGGVFPARLSVSRAGGDGGGAAGVVLLARDLTQQQELERRLRESEERHRLIVETIRDGVFIVRAENLLYANPALAAMLGMERETLQGLPFKNLVHARDLLRVLEIVRGALTGQERSGEFSCLLTQRGGANVEARIVWAGTEFQGSRAVIGTVADLTERARFQRELSESEARLQATLDSTGDGILVLEATAQGNAVSVANRAFCSLFGLFSDKVIGQPDSELRRLLLLSCADPATLEGFLRTADGEEEKRLESLDLVLPRRAVVSLVAGPLRSPGRERIGLILTARDVTARVDGERSLRESLEQLAKAKADLELAYREVAEAQKTLAQRNQQLEALNAELRSLDEMKSNLLANVSHELHTPLVSIKGYTEMVLKRKLGPLTPEQERGLNVSLKNIDRLIEMIDNLLSFSRMEKGETQLNLENLPVWQLIDEAIDLVGERIKKKNISVTTQYETDDLVVRADRGKVVQVLTNLLTNAVKFNREGGRITVTGRRGGRGFAEVDVSDTGIGIPPEAQEKIFERFYQIDSSPGRKYEGTGIGLSIVRDILRLHGCSIRVTSEPGQGSIFTFTLPLVRDQQASAVRPPGGKGRSRA
ncbi:MAG TPA: PAS domain S-box protein [Candidatus Polarisedimenticolia bacterium]|nr:PAS domain S-box protein [Candidatus Polarisedimenticolia bacterium]